MYSSKQRALQLSSRLHDCWEKDVDWELYPPELKEVSDSFAVMCNHVTTIFLRIALSSGGKINQHASYSSPGWLTNDVPLCR